MACRVTNEFWPDLVAAVKRHMVGRTEPNFMALQRETGIDRRTIASHWRNSSGARPSIKMILTGRADEPRVSTPPPAPLAVATPAPTPLATPTAEVVPADPLAAAIATIAHERESVGVNRHLSVGLGVAATQLLAGLHDDITALRTSLRNLAGTDPRQAVKLLRELAEIGDLISKSTARSVETERAIAGIVPSHELVVRHERGESSQDDAEEQAAANKELARLIVAASRRGRGTERYLGEESGFVEIDATPGAGAR
jgi:hypothetical protein